MRPSLLLAIAIPNAWPSRAAENNSSSAMVVGPSNGTLAQQTSSSSLLEDAGFIYEMHERVNCYDGHGGEDLPGVWLGKTADECGAICDHDAACSCFVLGSGEYDGYCWLRATCNTYSCETGDWRFTTYTQQGGGGGSALSVYGRHTYTNCYDGHGGSELPGVWHDISAEECAAVCDADPQCSCFVLGTGGPGGNCWKRSQCDLATCEYGDSRWDTYIKELPEVSWDYHSRTNCYEGHGARDLPGVWHGQTANSCASLCAADGQCDCFVLGSGDQAGKCWKRAGCRVWECEHGDWRWDTYTRQASYAEVASAPLALPGHGRWSKGQGSVEDSMSDGALAHYAKMERTSCSPPGSDMGPSSPNTSAVQCAELCEADVTCECFVHLPSDTDGAGPGSCWMRQDCNISWCEPNSSRSNAYVRDDVLASIFLSPGYYYYWPYFHPERLNWAAYAQDHPRGGPPYYYEYYYTYYYHFYIHSQQAEVQAQAIDSQIVEDHPRGGPPYYYEYYYTHYRYSHSQHADVQAQPVGSQPGRAADRQGRRSGTWTFRGATNCFQGHGASELPGVWYEKSVGECASICEDDGNCHCFVHEVSNSSGADAGSCHIRANCVFSECDLGDARWDAYAMQLTEVDQELFSTGLPSVNDTSLGRNNRRRRRRRRPCLVGAHCPPRPREQEPTTTSTPSLRGAGNSP